MPKVTAELDRALKAAPPLDIEVLTASELGVVIGGGPYEACTTGSRSMCMNDGVNEGDD